MDSKRCSIDGALVGAGTAAGALVAGAAAAATALVAGGEFVSSARDVNAPNAVIAIKAMVRRYRFMIL
ncbi:MAG: hypothetical protein ABSC01_10410 [Verrucomicrobiota bacterium]